MTLRFPLVNISPTVFHTNIRPYVSLARKINGENWELSKKQLSFGNREALDKNVIPLFI